MIELALFGSAVLGFIAGALSIALIWNKAEKESEQEYTPKWFVRFAFTRTYVGDTKPVGHWIGAYRIIETDDPDTIYDKLRKDLAYPNGKGGVFIRILDIHEL